MKELSQFILTDTLASTLCNAVQYVSLFLVQALFGILLSWNWMWLLSHILCLVVTVPLSFHICFDLAPALLFELECLLIEADRRWGRLDQWIFRSAVMRQSSQSIICPCRLYLCEQQLCIVLDLLPEVGFVAIVKEYRMVEWGIFQGLGKQRFDKNKKLINCASCSYTIMTSTGCL